MEQKTGTLVCRKCSGPHLTIKCGKDKIISETIPSETTPKHTGRKTYYEMKQDNEGTNKKNYSDKDSSEKNTYDKNFSEKNTHDKPRPRHFKSSYRVKLANLPLDMTEEEMMHMTCDWGHIVRLKVLNYEDTSVAYIDFGYEDEAQYFIEAIDRTPFEMLLLSAERKDREVVKELDL